MKILCQERYEKAVAYAKEIKNDTLQKCIDRLKQWEENSNCPCEIELYYDSAPHSFGFLVAPHRKPVTYSPVGDWFVFSRAHNLDTNPI